MIQIDDSYSEEFKELYFEKVKTEFRRIIKKKKGGIRWREGNVRDLLNNIQTIIGSKKYSEIFSGDKPLEKFRQLVLLPPDKLKELSEIINKRIECKKVTKKIFERKNIQRLKAVYTDGSIMSKEINNQKINTLMIDQLNINVCPYCNRNYINTRVDIENPSKSSFVAQMDHFYSKDKYPIFSVCLYNFIPVCGVCNRIKRTTDFKVFPFLEDEEKKHEVRFNYRYSNLDEIELYFETSDEREVDMNTIKLGEAYAIHHLDVKNMLIREEHYSKSYREELRDLFRSNGEVGNNVFQSSLADDEIDRMIFGDSVFEEDIKNISLGKFKKDIYQEIKSLRDY